MDAMSLVGKVSLIGCMACWIHFGCAGEMPTDANPVPDDPELAYIQFLSEKIHENEMLSSFIERKIDKNELKAKLAADENYACDKIESYMERDKVELREEDPGGRNDTTIEPSAYALLGFLETKKFKCMEIFLSKGGAWEVRGMLNAIDVLGDKFPYRNEIVDVMVQRLVNQSKRIDERMLFNKGGAIDSCFFEARRLKELLSDEKKCDAQKRDFGYSIIAGIPFANFSFLISQQKSRRLEIMEYYELCRVYAFGYFYRYRDRNV